MTMNLSDIQLIRQFAENDDHAAFAQLVDRYMNIAYSAAMTYLGKDDLARDACQLTFIELSKKASHLPEKVKLGGWIYITARNLSRKILRTEIRRQKREQKYVDQMENQPTTKVAWSLLTPDIHEALERLGEKDRDAIIMRYFQGKSLVEIGELLGVTTDAARMRVKRALNCLNGRLVKKGITSTAGALAAALPAHASLTAPAGMAATISTTVLAGAGTAISATTLTGVVLTIMKTKTLILAAVATTAVIGGSAYLANPSNKTPPITVADNSDHPTQPASQAEDEIIASTLSADTPEERVPEERSEARPKRGGPKQIIADMMKNPTMNKAVIASQRGVIGAMYEDFIDYLNLTPEEADYFIDLIMYRQIKLLNLMSAGDISADERAKLNQELLTADVLFKDNMDNFLNNPEDFAEWLYYEKTHGERMMLSQVDQILSGTEAALPDETYKSVLDMMYSEKQKFLSDDLLDPTNVDSKPERYSQDKLLTYANETKQLNREILTQAEQMLSKEQYAAFATSLKSTTELQFMQLRQASRLLSGWE